MALKHLKCGFCDRGTDIFLVVQLLICVQLFATPWTTAYQASLSITNSWSLRKLMSIESVMPSNHLILCCPLLLPPSMFPSIRVFSNKLALHIRWPKYYSFSFSFSFTLMNIQGWFPLGLTGWSPCCPRDSEEASPAPQFKSIDSLVLGLCHSPILTTVHDNGKNHSFDYIDLCWQCDVFAF